LKTKSKLQQQSNSSQTATTGELGPNADSTHTHKNICQKKVCCC